MKQNKGNKQSPENTKMMAYGDDQSLDNKINLEYIVKLVFMQNEGVKIGEDMIKALRKIKSGTYSLIFGTDFFEITMEKGSQRSTNEEAEDQQKMEIRGQNRNKSRQNIKKLVLQKIKQELVSGRQNASKIQQITSQNSAYIEQYKMQSQKDMDEINQMPLKKQNNDQNSQIAELKKIIANLQVQKKMQKKIIQQSNKMNLDKQNKIIGYKGTINKLQQHIIKQVRLQNDTDKTNSSQLQIQRPSQHTLKIKQSTNPLIKSQALQSEVVLLKKQIQTLKNQLTKGTQALILKNNQLSKLTTKYGSLQQLEKEKEAEFLVLSKEYSTIKEQVGSFLKENTTMVSKQMIENAFFSQQNNDDELDNNINLKAELQIVNEKYKRLQKDYLQLQNKSYKQIAIESKQPPTLKKNIQQLVTSQLQQQPQQIPKNKEKQKKKINTRRTQKQQHHQQQLKKQIDQEEQFIKDFKQICKTQKISDSISSFQAIINPTQMTAKIQQFDYNNSIIHKVSSSKFINSFNSKISFILQYACVLQRYFTKNFLSCIREQLMMSNTITIQTISPQDLNQQYFLAIQQSRIHDSSFISNTNNLCKSMTSSKMYINNQFSISEYTNVNQSAKGKQSTDDIVENIVPVGHSSQKTNQKRLKIHKLQLQLKQISAIIPNEYLNSHELKDEPELMSRLQSIKNNKISQMIINLIKQKQVFKKCLNELIKNQQTFTKQNNEIYFDENGELRRRTSNWNVKSITIQNKNSQITNIKQTNKIQHPKNQNNKNQITGIQYHHKDQINKNQHNKNQNCVIM